MNLIKPPFSKESAIRKVKLAEDAWNTKNPLIVVQAYSLDSKWRNRNEFFQGREAIKEFLTRKWKKELHYKLKKEMWSFFDNRISVRFEYEWQDAESKHWYKTYGNEHWEFDSNGLMTTRDMSANDISILESQRRLETVK